MLQLFAVLLVQLAYVARSLSLNLNYLRRAPEHHDLSFINVGMRLKSPIQVWVQSYGRSGSSTVLSMVEAASSGQESMIVEAASSGQTSLTRDSKNVFGLFEPCHEGDALSQDLRSAGCPGLLQSIADCDFSNIDDLWGYGNVHSIVGDSHRTSYSQSKARDNCKASDLIAFKTVSFGHNLTRDALPLLENNPHLYIIDVVRDPRGIFASWKHYAGDGWSDLWQRRSCKSCNIPALKDICDNYEANIHVDHPRIKRIAYEQLIDMPELVMREAYQFLGLQFGSAQLSWIDKTFNAHNCEQRHEGLRDCHTNSSEPLERFRQRLSTEELAAFASHSACQTVAATYDFKL